MFCPAVGWRWQRPRADQRHAEDDPKHAQDPFHPAIALERPDEQQDAEEDDAYHLISSARRVGGGPLMSCRGDAFEAATGRLALGALWRDRNQPLPRRFRPGKVPAKMSAILESKGATVLGGCPERARRLPSSPSTAPTSCTAAPETGRHRPSRS